MPPEPLSIPEARRLALAAQGFDRPRPAGRIDARHLRRAIRRIGLLQIDYVNVLIPAQYLVPFSRLGPYDRSRLDVLIYRRREFTEQWAHEASILPTEHWPLLRHRMDGHDRRTKALARFLARHEMYAARVLEEVRERGPLSAEDVTPPDQQRPKKRGGWGWSFQKAALEAHFAHGRLAVTHRLPNYARVYDLAERVIPPDHFHDALDHAEAQRELIRLAARACGVSTARDLADYYRMPIGDARLRIRELADAGELREIDIEGWRDPAYVDPEAKRPRRIDAATLLSPFDPLIWHRPRTERLFAFAYRIEIYVPEAKRRWGYYVLPFLLGDRLVARVDLKADRANGRLLVPAAHVESGVRPDEVVGPLAAELWAVARWLDLEAVRVGRRGGLARPLVAAVRAASP
jgi:uncharacterized protein YcaQ